MIQKDDSVETIIITRRKEYDVVVTGAVWKIAYADFVTAMMAFFLLLWLTSVMTQQQAAGISDFFSPPKDAVQSELTESLEGLTFDPDNVLSALEAAPDISDDTPNLGGERAGDREGEQRDDLELTDFAQADMLDTPRSEDERLEESGEQLGASLSEHPRLRELRRSFTVEDTPLGVRIDLASAGSEENIFLNPISSELTPYGQRLLSEVFGSLISLPNDIIIMGHTQNADSLRTLDPQIDPVRLSLDRALSTRRWLEFLDFPEDRISRLDGRADRLNQRLVGAENLNEQNRISLYLVALQPDIPGDIARPITDIDPADILPVREGQ